MESSAAKRLGRVGWLLILAALLTTNSGCLAVAAGVAAGGAAGYAYYQGNVQRTYGASLDDTWNATVAALHDLGMPLVENTRGAGSGSIISRTANGDRVAINLDVQPSKIPAEGSVTRVGLRIAVFGDHPVSDRILDQIGFHLVQPPLAPAPATPPAGPAATASQANAVVPASAQVPAPSQPPRWSAAPGTTRPPSRPAPAPPQTVPPPLLPGEK